MSQIDLLGVRVLKILMAWKILKPMIMTTQNQRNHRCLDVLVLGLSADKRLVLPGLYHDAH